MFQQVPQLQPINIHQLLEKCKSKKELYRFLQQDCQAFLPKMSSVNVYFFKQIMKCEKEFQKYIKRKDVKVSCAPHIEGLTVQDFLHYARQKADLLRYLPQEKDWLHLDRQWISDILYTIDTEEFQNMIDNAIIQRQEKQEVNKNQTIMMRPEFVQALQQCIQFSNERGKSAFMIKDSSKRKRTRQEIQEVKDEEEKFKDDKQEYLREHKRLKREQLVLKEQIVNQQRSQELLNSLVDAGIINQDGDILLQQEYVI